MRKKFIATVLLVATIGLIFSLATAQEIPPIQIGENKLGDISAAAPQASFAFTAFAGQVINIEVLAVTPNLAPTVTIVNEGGALVQSIGNPTALSTLTGTVTLPTAGTYLIQVQSATNTPGQFVITISEGGPPPVPLLENQPAIGTLTPGSPVRYSFTGNPGSILQLQITGSPTNSPAVKLTNSSGKELANTTSDLPFVTLGIPAGIEESYVLSLVNDRPDGQVLPYQVLLVLPPPAGGQGVPTPVNQNPQPTLALPELPTTGSCVLATQGQNVNVRQGPAQEYPVITQISYQGVYNVIGRNENSSWYLITLSNGSSGWVSGGVTRRGGNCASLPVAAYPPLGATLAPTVTGTPPTASPSATQPSGTPPTATWTYTPTSTATQTLPAPDATAEPGS